MTPQEILLAAADGLAEHEWIQGASFVDKDGRRWRLDYLLQSDADPVGACALGAIALVGMNHVDACNRAVGILERHLAGGDPDLRPSIPTWNDKRGRTKGEVVETMRRAAKG